MDKAVLWCQLRGSSCDGSGENEGVRVSAEEITVVWAQVKIPTVDPVFSSEVLLAWEIIGRELI